MEIDFSKYLPVLAAVISVSLGYMYGVRSKKNDRIMQLTQESLKEVYSPMFHEISRIISKMVKPIDREKMMDSFFDKYASDVTSVYKLGNLGLMQSFYELSNKYQQFKLTRDSSVWKDVWYEFEEVIFYEVKSGYMNSVNLLYRDFKWQQYIQAKPYWMKLYFESIKFLHETANGAIVTSAILLYFSGFFRLLGLGLFPKDFWVISLIIFVMSVLASLFLALFNMQYIILSSNIKQSLLRKSMNKIFPKLLFKWDGLFSVRKNYNKVPPMYDINIHKD
ncbi:hypothetical protein [Paenibacillus sp. YIM B09110]|uniref:hypothetical protein n=1 Tax=Paenibacillus sp. YIM B09110 TaxID=3126102 RepID=UPI00301B82C3